MIVAMISVLMQLISQCLCNRSENKINTLLSGLGDYRKNRGLYILPMNWMWDSFCQGTALSLWGVDGNNVTTLRRRSLSFMQLLIQMPPPVQASTDHLPILMKYQKACSGWANYMRSFNRCLDMTAAGNWTSTTRWYRDSSVFRSLLINVFESNRSGTFWIQCMVVNSAYRHVQMIMPVIRGIW